MKKLVAGVLLIAVAASAYFYLDEKPAPVPRSKAPVAEASHSDKGVKESSNAQNGGTHYFIPITGGKPRPLATMDPFFRVPKTREGLALDGDPFVAESVQEQQWLDRHGYPNAQQWAAYSAAPDLVLEQAAAAGDGVADVMLAARQLAGGDRRASGKLMTAGRNGSNFALSLLAAYLSNGKYGNPELGYAVSRVIELRGDWRAGITRDVMLSKSLSPEQRARAEIEAIKLLNSLKSGSGAQPYVDPRPMSPKQQG